MRAHLALGLVAMVALPLAPRLADPLDPDEDGFASHVEVRGCTAFPSFLLAPLRAERTPLDCDGDGFGNDEERALRTDPDDPVEHPNRDPTLVPTRTPSRCVLDEPCTWLFDVDDPDYLPCHPSEAPGDLQGHLQYDPLLHEPLPGARFDAPSVTVDALASIAVERDGAFLAVHLTFAQHGIHFLTVVATDHGYPPVCSGPSPNGAPRSAAVSLIVPLG